MPIRGKRGSGSGELTLLTILRTRNRGLCQFRLLLSGMIISFVRQIYLLPSGIHFLGLTNPFQIQKIQELVRCQELHQQQTSPGTKHSEAPSWEILLTLTLELRACTPAWPGSQDRGAPPSPPRATCRQRRVWRRRPRWTWWGRGAGTTSGTSRGWQGASSGCPDQTMFLQISSMWNKFLERRQIKWSKFHYLYYFALHSSIQDMEKNFWVILLNIRKIPQLPWH